MRTVLSVILVTVLAAGLYGADIYVNPGDDVQTIVSGISSTDDVIFNAGTYNINHIVIQNKHGSPSDWITIRAAEGATVILDGNPSYNTIDFYDASYIHIKGFEIINGSDGIKFNAGVTASNIIIEDCYIHDIDNVGVNSQGQEVSYVTVKKCKIMYCSTCGLYLGRSDGSGIIHHWTISNCYVAYCGGTTTGYGIQIKHNSYANVIEDSVWHDVAGSSRAGVAVYATFRSDADRNIVRRNVIWNVPRYNNSTTTPGIWANADAVIENNIVFDSGWGFHTNSNVTSVNDLTVVNNTFYNCNIGLNEQSGANCIAANNAAYACNTNLNENGDWTNVNNLSGSSGTGVFVSTSFGHPSFLYPTQDSPLVDAGNGTYAPADDFNLTSRPFNGVVDVGAYEWTQVSNPGWTITEGFKDETSTTDTDGDGMDDNWELANFGDLSHDGTGDTDGDGLSDLAEFQNGTDPNKSDTDNDGLSDGEEVNTHSTDPLNWDTDGDTYSDGIEVTAGTDPTNPADHPTNEREPNSVGGSSGCTPGAASPFLVLLMLCACAYRQLRRPRSSS